jgi:hypothetical protein
MMTLSRDWARFSRICHHILLAESPSTPWLVRRTRYVVETSALEYLLVWSSRAHPSCVLQDDIAKYVSDPTPPRQLENISEEGQSKVKERREVGEGDDTVTIEDTSDEEDGETLQEHFQLRSRFSRPGLPHIPFIDDRPTSLEASLPVPQRKPRNVARKCVAKKLKVTETTTHEVSSSSRVVEYLSWSLAC